MDLVYEQNVARLERGQDRRQIALSLQRRPGHRSDSHAELLAEDVGEAGLAEAGRPDQQHVVERLAARARGLECDRQLFLHSLLAHELVEAARAKRALDLVVLWLERRGEELFGHAALRACRTRSSGGNSGSTAARARSASGTE
jgi:hypothetical protein